MKNRKTILVGILVGAVLTVLIILVFVAGLHIGSRRAGALPFWERRYGFPQHGFVGGKFGHGTNGVIDSLGNNSLVVKERSGALITVLVDDKTTLRRDGSSIKFADLKGAEQVIVIGEPQKTEGAILAKVVRVFSSPAQATESGTFGKMRRLR